MTLCFGRIDEDPVMSDGDTWYVGSRHIEDESGAPVVVDWRAPVAVPFHRATAVDPFGLARRRFSCDIDELVAIFDEQLDDPDSISAASIPDPVFAEIERGRSGEMSDIVATIAAEQDASLPSGHAMAAWHAQTSRRRSLPCVRSCSVEDALPWPRTVV